MPNLFLPNHEGLLELVTFDTTNHGGQVFHYANSKMDDGSEIEVSSFQFMAITWIVLPFLSEGFSAGGDNPQNPSISLPDFDGSLITQLRLMGGCPGSPISLQSVLAADVLADRASGTFSHQEYVLNRYARSKQTVTLELATPWNYGKTCLPSSTMTREFYPGLGSALSR